MAERLRLGVNIDHVATVRNARGGALPDPVRAAHLAIDAGADGITAHLREDRRHIRDADMRPPRQRTDEAAQFRDGGHRRDDGIGGATEAACGLPRAGEARGAHHRRRPRRRPAGNTARAAHRAAESGGLPRLALHRAGRGADRDGGQARRAGRRAAHRKLVPRRSGWRDGARPRPNSGGLPNGAALCGQLGPRGPCRTWARLRDGARARRCPGVRRVQHRPFPDRRGDLHRAGSRHPPDAAGHGRRPRSSA